MPENAMETAALLHQMFLCELLTELRDCGDLRELVGAPPERLDALRSIFSEVSGFAEAVDLAAAREKWMIIGQGAGDLGDRMQRWFARHLSRTNEPSCDRKCVLIGADCPLLSSVDVDAAWTALRDHDLVLGPALDGGYYLIGLRRRDGRADIDLAALFDGVAWSTSSVLTQTLDGAERAGMSVFLLPMQRDVDDADDLKALMQTLRESGRQTHPILRLLSGMKFR